MILILFIRSGVKCLLEVVVAYVRQVQNTGKGEGQVETPQAMLDWKTIRDSKRRDLNRLLSHFKSLFI